MRLEEKDFFCGHLPFSDTISKILDDCDIRIIQSLRDPRDVLASQLAFALNNPEHFLHQTLQKLDSDTEQQRLILQGSLAGESLHRSLSTQYREMERWKSSRKILFIKYEDLVGKHGNGNCLCQRKTVEEIANFLEISISRSEINAISERLYEPNTPGFWVGKIGRWTEVLTPDFMELFNSEMCSTMKIWGYA